jgi:hypothetical protein
MEHALGTGGVDAAEIMERRRGAAGFRAEVDPFVHDVAVGVPRTELGWYRANYEGQDMWKGMTDLHKAGIGIFRQLRVDDSVSPPPGRRIDGLDTGGSGWSTVGGSASAGTLQQQAGQPILRWDYGSAPGTVPTLTRWFPAPENLSADALAISFEGQGSGRIVHLRLVLASGAHGLDYWETGFVDSQTGPRTIVLPWLTFAHLSPNGQLDYQTSLTSLMLQRAVGLVFGITDPGRGSLVIQRLSVGAGYPELIPPGWPEVYRHSLPPWPTSKPPWLSG